jgi:hypothetical protein
VEVLRGPSLPNPNFTRVRVVRNSAASDYHSFQLQFQRRLAQGPQALASYTWSHSIDDVSFESRRGKLSLLVARRPPHRLFRGGKLKKIDVLAAHPRRFATRPLAKAGSGIAMA